MAEVFNPQPGPQEVPPYSASYYRWRGVGDFIIGTLGSGMAVFGGLNLIFPYETKVSSMMLAGGALIGGYFIPSSYGSFDQYNELIAPPTEAAGTPNEPIDPPVEAADIPGDDLGHAA